MHGLAACSFAYRGHPTWLGNEAGHKPFRSRSGGTVKVDEVWEADGEDQEDPWGIRLRYSSSGLQALPPWVGLPQSLVPLRHAAGISEGRGGCQTRCPNLYDSFHQPQY